MVNSQKDKSASKRDFGTYHICWSVSSNRGGSSISGKGVHTDFWKGVPYMYMYVLSYGEYWNRRYSKKPPYKVI